VSGASADAVRLLAGPGSAAAATMGGAKAINYIVKREHSDGNLKQQSA
jgi:hypothetical protein